MNGKKIKPAVYGGAMREFLARAARWTVPLVAVLLLSQGAAFAAKDICITVEVPDPIRLPDGSEHPAGLLTLCLHRDWSPVLSLHKTYINRAPIGMFLSRRGVSEGPAEAESYVMFSREPDGRLRLDGYALPCQGHMETYSLHQPTRRKAKDSVLAAEGSGPSGDTMVLIAAAELTKEVGFTRGEKKKRAPSGFRVTEPEVLAGPPKAVRAPRLFEQLEVFGEPSTFPRNIIDPVWRPESDWDNSTHLNNFNPSRWQQAPTDPNWDPEPAFTEDDDVTNFNPSRWQKGAVDPNWYPEDGFNRRNTTAR